MNSDPAFRRFMQVSTSSSVGPKSVYDDVEVLCDRAMELVTPIPSSGNAQADAIKWAAGLRAALCSTDRFERAAGELALVKIHDELVRLLSD